MPAPEIDRSASLIRKLQSLNDLSAEEVSALQALPLRKLAVRAGTTIVAEGQLVSECCVLVSGFACRHKVARDGKRQIVSFHVAGDMLDVQHLLFENADHNLQMITDGEVAFFPISLLRTLVRERPDVAMALWRDCLVDASIFREWVLNAARRDAKMRIAHMLCEFATRCEVAGLGSPETLWLPMTQEHIGDATGLTSVHVNRTLRSLREDGALEGAGRFFKVGDWNQLRYAAGFNPAYLHLAA
jgi:CRP-like cAMP-binding protein